MSYKLLVDDNLKVILKKLYKKDRLRYEICMKKMEEIEGFEKLPFGPSKPHQNPLEGFDGHT